MTDDDTTHDTDVPTTDDPQDDADAGFDFDRDGAGDGPPEDTTPDDAPEATAGEYTLDGDDADPPRTGGGPPPVRDRRGGAQPRDTTHPDDSDGRIRTYVLWAALGVLGLFSVVLLFQFYGSTMQAITDWVGPEYRSVVRSAVSLVLLCLTLVGVVQVTRELTD